MTALSAPVGGVQWSTLVREWLAATARAKAGDTSGLRVFINTRLAETWEDKGERVEQGTLEARVEPRWERLPAGVRALTAGVDTHDDRLEVSVYGWGLGFEGWLVAHLTIPTDPLADETWAALDAAILAPRWERENGTYLRVASACIDAGGHRTQAVLEYAMDSRRRGTVAATIGARVPSAPIWQPKAGKSSKVKGARFNLIGRHASSEALAAMLRVHTPGPLYLHVPEGTPAHWFAEMTAQKRVESTIRAGRDRGRKVWQWEPITAGADDHAWDCARYALAALHRLVSMGLRLEAPRTDEATKAPAATPAKPSEPILVKPTVDKLAKPAHDTPQVRPGRPKPRARSPWGWRP
jgi:phage terminase large subunit GpA-like protein